MSKLSATARLNLGKKVKQDRKQEILPAVLFGPKYGNTAISVNAREFEALFKQVGYSALIEVELDGKIETALIKEVQIHPITRKPLHANFYVVDQKTEVSTEVPFTYVGVSPAEDLGVGFIVYAVDTLAIRCLPKDLPDHIELSRERLVNAGDAITVADITLPAGVELDPKVEISTAIAYVATAQKMEEEESASAPVAETAEGAAVESEQQSE